MITAPEKIIFPFSLPHLFRPRLLSLLKRSRRTGQATLLTGRSGTGKTTLASDFAREFPSDAAWFTVEATEVSLPLFIDYFSASIERIRPGFAFPGFDFRDLSFADSTPSEIWLLAEEFVGRLQMETEPLLAVIDDLHLIDEAPWAGPFFQRLISTIPPEVHLLIVSRTLPRIPLWGLRSKQRLAVFDESSLAFTREEAAALFAFYGRNSREAAALRLLTRGHAGALSAAARGAGLDCLSNLSLAECGA